MALGNPDFRVDVPQDWDAGLREKILACVSDPKSGVIQFPARTNPHRRIRRASLSTVHHDLVPRPRTPSNGRNYRVAETPKIQRAKMPPIFVYALTVLASLIIGTGIGLVAVQYAAPTAEMTAQTTITAAQAPAILSTLPIATFTAPATGISPYVTTGQAATQTAAGAAAQDTTLTAPTSN